MMRPGIYLTLASLSVATTAGSFIAPHAFAGDLIDRIEASVNSSLILLSDVENFRKTIGLRAQLDPIFAGTPVANAGAKASEKDIVEFLIEERLIAQQFPVTDAEVEQEINSIQANNHIDRSQLKQALKEQGYDFDNYFEMIRTSAAKRNLIDREIRAKVTISDDDIRNYFYNHFSKSSSVPYSYTIKLITITPASYKTATAEREAAEDALKAVRSGEEFGEVAKRMSDDASATSGGDLGTLSEDQVSPGIREALKSMKPGDTSGLLGDAKSGYFILKLVDRKSGEEGRLAKMRDEIRNQLTAAEYQHQISLWLERQRQSAFIHRAGEPSVAGLPVVK